MLSDFQDPEYGMVSNSKNPLPRSWDNPGLFTAQASILGAKGVDWYLFVKNAYSSWSRWPFPRNEFESKPPSHDELIGWAILSDPAFVEDFIIPRVDLLETRFVDLIPFLKSRAGLKLTLLDQILWSVVTVLSTNSPYEDTSGKCKKWVQLKSMSESNYPICKWAIGFWQTKMSRQYKQGLHELFGIYFGPEHWLTQNAPGNFAIK